MHAVGEEGDDQAGGLGTGVRGPYNIFPMITGPGAEIAVTPVSTTTVIYLSIYINN